MQHYPRVSQTEISQDKMLLCQQFFQLWLWGLDYAKVLHCKNGTYVAFITWYSSWLVGGIKFFRHNLACMCCIYCNDSSHLQVQSEKDCHEKVSSNFSSYLMASYLLVPFDSLHISLHFHIFSMCVQRPLLDHRERVNVESACKCIII